MKRKMILPIIAAYLIFLWDCEIRYSNKNFVYNIEYKGLLWVILDYWTIRKYNLLDEPMKWLTWKRTAL